MEHLAELEWLVHIPVNLTKRLAQRAGECNNHLLNTYAKLAGHKHKDAGSRRHLDGLAVNPVIGNLVLHLLELESLRNGQAYHCKELVAASCRTVSFCMIA